MRWGLLAIELLEPVFELRMSNTRTHRTTETVRGVAPWCPLRLRMSRKFSSTISHLWCIFFSLITCIKPCYGVPHNALLLYVLCITPAHDVPRSITPRLMISFQNEGFKIAHLTRCDSYKYAIV